MAPADLLLGATADVAATVAWLESEGWALVADRGPSVDGDLLLRFRSLRGDEAAITRDRGQWMLALTLVGWERAHDIDLVLVAVTGEVPARWDASQRWQGPMSEQLPVGVEWRRALPVVLDRLRTDREAEDRIAELARLRASRMVADASAGMWPLPPTRRHRRPWPRRPH
jgi:hypothetical protein